MDSLVKAAEGVVSGDAESWADFILAADPEILDGVDIHDLVRGDAVARYRASQALVVAASKVVAQEKESRMQKARVSEEMARTPEVSEALAQSRGTDIYVKAFGETLMDDPGESLAEALRGAGLAASGRVPPDPDASRQRERVSYEGYRGPTQDIRDYEATGDTTGGFGAAITVPLQAEAIRELARQEALEYLHRERARLADRKGKEPKKKPKD